MEYRGPKVKHLRSAVIAGLALVATPTRGSEPVMAPEFPTTEPSHWVGAPVTLGSLRGQVVLLDVWTFGCINCVRTIPWVRQSAARFGSRGLAIVGIHTPEFAHERVRDAVVEHVRKHRLEFPHLLDNDSAYWKALHNEYWPALYLVDRCGRIRASAVGEVHLNEPSGQRLEARIEELLKEDGRGCH
jgi:thiol-disulfide isomerase/thioredoxin